MAKTVMEPDGVRRAGDPSPRRVRLHPGGDRVSDFDAALHRIDKLLRLNEWRLALLLENLEELSAKMDRAARAWEGVGR